MVSPRKMSSATNRFSVEDVFNAVGCEAVSVSIDLAEVKVENEDRKTKDLKLLSTPLCWSYTALSLF